MPDDLDFPTIPDDLLAALDRRFPAKNPLPDTTLARIMYSAGQRSVVEFMRAVQAERSKPSWPEE